MSMGRPKESGARPDVIEAIERAGRAHTKAREKVDATRAELEVLVLRAARAGASSRVIADAAGISFQRVHQIVKGATP